MSTEYDRLRHTWEQARKALDAPYPTDSDDYAEQRAWDALIDYVEANDLTYTDKDPRETNIDE